MVLKRNRKHTLKMSSDEVLGCVGKSHLLCAYCAYDEQLAYTACLLCL